MSYIEREKLIDWFRPYGHNDEPIPFESLVEYVRDEAPAADVAPVVHGEWVEAKLNGMSLYPVGQKMCSVCGQIMPSRWETMPPFCYGCGAKMDAKSEVEK